MPKMLEWFNRMFTQDAFEDDWYGWLTNQISHLALGVTTALFTSVIWYWVFNEFPFKVVIWPAITAVYVGLEVVRGWDWWDSIEDTIFFSAYGAGGAFLVFSEVTPGSPVLTASATDVLPILGLACIHLLAGAYLRTPEV